MQVLDPSPRESLRNSPFLKWTEMSRALQEGVEEIHLSYVRVHFDVYHGEGVCSGTEIVHCQCMCQSNDTAQKAWKDGRQFFQVAF